MRVGKFYKGAEFAGVVILDIADGETWNREALYRVRCKECGAITEIRGSSLQNRMERWVTGCSVCRKDALKKANELSNPVLCCSCESAGEYTENTWELNGFDDPSSSNVLYINNKEVHAKKSGGK